jgi:hypothetical protein
MTASGDDRGRAAASGELRRAGGIWADFEALAADEARLVADERFDALLGLYDRRDALLAAMPRPLPTEALEPLRRALSTQRATASVLAARRDALSAELGRLHRGRTGVRGYARAYDVGR